MILLALSNRWNAIAHICIQGKKVEGLLQCICPLSPQNVKAFPKPSSNFYLDLIGQNCVSWSLLAGREVVEASILSTVPHIEPRFINKEDLKIALGIEGKGMGGG